MFEIRERVWRYATEIDIWLGVSFCVSALLAVCCLYLWKSRSRERAMSRSSFERRVAPTIELALRNAVVAGQITNGDYVRFCKEAGAKLGFVSLVPVVKPQLVQFPDGKWRLFPVIHLDKLRKQAYKRLLALGLSSDTIVKKLSALRLRRSPPRKPDEVLAKLRRV